MTGKRPEGMRCPRCGKAALEKSFPFCSDRCRLIDLARWIDGDYRIPAQEPVDEEAFSAAEQNDKTIH